MSVIFKSKTIHNILLRDLIFAVSRRSASTITHPLAERIIILLAHICQILPFFYSNYTIPSSSPSISHHLFFDSNFFINAFISAISFSCDLIISSASFRTSGSSISARLLVKIAIEWWGIIAFI